MDLRSADLPLLVSLEALVSARSVTRAAERLGLSQPALSAQLARLRDLFDDPLLVGNAHGMVPTRRAEELVVALDGPLADIAAVVRGSTAFDPTVSSATIRLVGSEQTNSIIGVPLMARLRSVAPNMRLALYAFQAAVGADLFRLHDLDLGLLTPSMKLSGMMSTPLFDDDLVVVRRKEDRRPLDLDLYLSSAHILVSTTGGVFSAGVDEALTAQGLSRDVRASVQSFSVALAMAAASDLMTTLPRRYAKRWTHMVRIDELPLSMKRFSFQMVWPKRLDADPMHKWLRQEVQEIADQVDNPG